MSQMTVQQRPAELARWDPFQELQSLQRQIAQVFQGWPGMNGGSEADFVPLADVEETDEAYVVELELPGVKKGDVQIEIAGRRLVVTGERKEKERKGVMRRRTRLVGRFRHEILLPGDVDESGVEATLNEGVLTIRVPKAAAERPRSITVK
jgi:HSP20 family protein